MTNAKVLICNPLIRATQKLRSQVEYFTGFMPFLPDCGDKYMLIVKNLKSITRVSHPRKVNSWQIMHAIITLLRTQ